jgi:cytochrome c oxidase assembly protein subunit 23
MGTQVPPSKVPTPEQERPAPPKKEDEMPDDYRKTFRVSLGIL